MSEFYIVKKVSVATVDNIDHFGESFTEYYGKHNVLLAVEGILPYDILSCFYHPLYESQYSDGYLGEKKAKTNRTYRSPDTLDGWSVSVEIIKVEMNS